MIPRSAEVAAAIYGAWRLLRLDPGGMQFFERTPDGFWKSFFAAAIVAPGYLILVLLHLSDMDATAGPFRIFLVQSIAFVISWTAFPLLMHQITQMIDRQEAYIGYIVALNWSKVIQMGIYLPVSVLTFSDILPSALAALINLVASLGILAYQWFVTRTALDITGFAAVGVVLLDLIIGIFITAVADGMIS